MISQAVKRPNQGLLVADRTKMTELKGHRKTLTDIAFTPNGRWAATASLDRSIRLWDARTGKMLARFLAGHRDWIRTLAFQPDGNQLCSGGDDGAIRLWDLTKGKRLQRVQYTWVGTYCGIQPRRHASCCWWSRWDGEYLVSGEFGVAAAIGTFGRTINKIVSYDGVAICIAMEGQIEAWHMRENKRLYRRSRTGRVY